VRQINASSYLRFSPTSAIVVFQQEFYTCAVPDLIRNPLPTGRQAKF
jgi:hypothetical protein